MRLTLDQVTEMAPDAGSAAAAKKLMALQNWKELSCSADAIWGLCQGSALYQVEVDLSNLGYHCSCPSRKFPCKHTLGLLMLFASTPDALRQAAVPDWVNDWLTRRRAKVEKKQEKATEPPKPVDEKAQARRAERREARVQDGIQLLDLWLKDLVRNGLAGLETKPTEFWFEPAKRLVDAQAPVWPPVSHDGLPSPARLAIGRRDCSPNSADSSCSSTHSGGSISSMPPCRTT